MTQTSTGRILTYIISAGLISFSSAVAADLLVGKADGGPVVTELGYGITINKNSSLHRAWYWINDTSCPVQLTTSGMRSEYKTTRGTGAYAMRLYGSFTPSADVSAALVVTVTFDMFGRLVQSYAWDEISDHHASIAVDLSKDHEWRTSENDVSTLLTSVTYVRYVRTPDGKLWGADMSAVSKKLAAINLVVSAEGLESKTK